MKLIIDIPDNEYKQNKHYYDSVYHGIPLDDVKAEIAEEICLTDNPYTKETKYTIEHSKLLDILDNIGKESEEV